MRVTLKKKKGFSNAEGKVIRDPDIKRQARKRLWKTKNRVIGAQKREIEIFRSESKERAI